MSVKFLLLCGYRGTGKDTFVDELLFRQENWAIYGKEEGVNYEEVYRIRSKLGLADSVKKQVAQQLGLPLSISQIDKLKDVMVISGKKLREWINEYTTKKAMEDKFYWENMAMKLIDEDKDDNEYVISDFRYRRTYDFFSDNKGGVITARLFRSDNTVPDKKEKTEHILDDFITDFLLVPNVNTEEHFNKCIQILPQYNDFKLLYKPEILENRDKID
jgi:hypothetical protein